MPIFRLPLSAALPLALLSLVPAQAAPARHHLTLPVAAPDSRQPKKVTLTDKDNGQKVMLNAGDTLIVRLKSNVTTGYSWRMAGETPDKALSSWLTMAGEPGYVPDPHAPHVVGSGGVQVFRFHAPPFKGAMEAIHAVPLMLEYRGPGDNGTGPAAKQWQVTVQVAWHEKFRKANPH